MIMESSAAETRSQFAVERSERSPRIEDTGERLSEAQRVSNETTSHRHRHEAVAAHNLSGEERISMVALAYTEQERAR